MRIRPAVSALTVAVLVLLLAALAGAASASAASVVNGGFETGTLEGWQTYNSNEEVSWVATEASGPEEGPPPPGLTGEVAESQQHEPGTTVLYQDVALEPGYSHILTMTLYYRTQTTITVPERDSLYSEGPFTNQQFRVDVVKPNAPPESLSPNDILATVFSNKTEDPMEMKPTQFKVDLSQFAGQTVQIRLAVAANERQLNAAVDDVAITSTPIPAPPAPPAPSPLPPSSRIQKGTLTLNRKHGTAMLAVTVPGAGTLTAMDARIKIAVASARRQGPAKPALIKTTTLHPTVAGPLQIPIRPTAAGLKALTETGHLQVRARLTFTPAGGTAATQVYKARLAKTLTPRR